MYYPSACARAAPVACLQLSHYSLAILHADAAAAAVIANFSSRLRPSCACRCSSTVFSTSSRRPSLASSSCPALPADTRQSERERPPPFKTSSSPHTAPEPVRHPLPAMAGDRRWAVCSAAPRCLWRSAGLRLRIRTGPLLAVHASRLPPPTSALCRARFWLPLRSP